MNALAKVRILTKYSARLLLNSRHGGCQTTASKSQHHYDVKTFGELRVRTGLSSNVIIGSIDAVRYPNQNVAFVEDGKGDKSLSTFRVAYSQNRLSIDNAEGRNINKLSDSSNTCTVSVPVRFNLDVEVRGKRNVIIQNMHSDDVQARLEHGTCLLKKLQCGTVVVRSMAGDIVSEGTLQCNAVFETQANGTVKLYKPLCQRLSVSTSAGDIHVTSLYADVSTFNTQSGSVYIGSAHRDINIEIADRGSVVIDSLDGSLNCTVRSGNVSLYVSRHTGVNISVETGDIKLKLSDSLRARVELIGSVISFDDKLDTSGLSSTKDKTLTIMRGVLQGQDEDEVVPVFSSEVTRNEPEIKVKTLNGSVEVVQQDWFSTLKLSNSASSETITKL